MWLSRVRDLEGLPWNCEEAVEATRMEYAGCGGWFPGRGGCCCAVPLSRGKPLTNGRGHGNSGGAMAPMMTLGMCHADEAQPWPKNAR